MPTPEVPAEPASTADDELLTPSEVRTLLKVSRQTVWRYGAQGLLNPLRIGGGRTIRYRRSEVRALVSAEAS
jgi:predicted DNA-binding transcriptional regulator AlpA